MKVSHLITAFVSLSTAVSAWPYPQSLVGPLDRMDALYRRQDNNNNNAGSGNAGNGGNTPSDTPANNPNAQPTPDSSITSVVQSNQPSRTSSAGNNDNNSNTGSESGPTRGATTTGSGRQTNPSITTGPTSSRRVSVDPQAPAGGLSMIQPDPFQGSVYYRLGQNVTWQWNYTSLAIPPKHINILATTSGTSAGAAPTAPFTLAANYSFAPTETFTWDTAKFTQQQVLPMGTYTLMVYDADISGGLTATPEPGRLGLWQQFYFGLYQGEDRQDLPNSYICATCNAAGGQMERLTLGFLFGTFAVTAGSFLWFAGPLAGLI